jgi:hypothetical protein
VKTIVPIIFIMIGCIMLGGGLYLGRIVEYKGKITVVDFWKRGTNYEVHRIYSGTNVNSIQIFKGEMYQEETREAILFTEIPRPENVRLYNIENVIFTIVGYGCDPANYLPNGATVNDWRDFVINIGKLRHPEDYLNPNINLWNFDMDLIGQFNTAELKTGSPYVSDDRYVYQKCSPTSYKFRYNGESIIGIGMIPITSLPYPPYGDYAVIFWVGLKFEGKGLVKLYGYIIDENGNPIDKVCISCDYGIVYTDENGYYEINVPSESLDVSYCKEGYENQIMKIDIPDRDNYRVDVMLTKLTIPTPEENVPEENILENIPTYTPPERYPINKSKVLIFGGVGMILIGLVSLMIILTQNVRREMRI